MAEYIDPIHRQLEYLYSRYHKKEYISPDPLQVLSRYPDKKDREIAGLIASSLALGRVQSILNAVEKVLSVFANLRDDLLACSRRDVAEMFAGFTYRFFSGEHVASFLWGIRETVGYYGSLEACFLEGLNPEDETILPALCSFTETLTRKAGGSVRMLLTSPEKKSACKRHLLYLRWMVRKDDIDPGGWDAVSPSLLVVPVDTHMLRMSRRLGLTIRGQADLTTALEITEGLKRYCPQDPVKYDFSMTRPGIHPGLDPSIQS